MRILAVVMLLMAPVAAAEDPVSVELKSGESYNNCEEATVIDGESHTLPNGTWVYREDRTRDQDCRRGSTGSGVQVEAQGERVLLVQQNGYEHWTAHETSHRAYEERAAVDGTYDEESHGARHVRSDSGSHVEASSPAGDASVTPMGCFVEEEESHHSTTHINNDYNRETHEESEVRREDGCGPTAVLLGTRVFAGQGCSQETDMVDEESSNDSTQTTTRFSTNWTQTEGCGVRASVGEVAAGADQERCTRDLAYDTSDPSKNRDETTCAPYAFAGPIVLP